MVRVWKAYQLVDRSKQHRTTQLHKKNYSGSKAVKYTNPPIFKHIQTCLRKGRVNGATVYPSLDNEPGWIIEQGIAHSSGCYGSTAC